MQGTNIKNVKITPIDDEQILLDKCQFLLDCIESSKIDPERVSIGDAPHYQISFTEAEILRLKGKLFQLIEKF